MVKGNNNLIHKKVFDVIAENGYTTVGALHRALEGITNVTVPTLFTVLHQLEEAGWIIGDWRYVDNRHRKYYKPAGKRQAKEQEGWNSLAAKSWN